MKRLFMALLTCLVIVGVSGCGEKQQTPTVDEQTQTEENAGGGDSE